MVSRYTKRRECHPLSPSHLYSYYLLYISIPLLITSQINELKKKKREKKDNRRFKSSYGTRSGTFFYITE